MLSKEMSAQSGDGPGSPPDQQRADQAMARLLRNPVTPTAMTSAPRMRAHPHNPPVLLGGVGLFLYGLGLSSAPFSGPPTLDVFAPPGFPGDPKARANCRTV